MYRLIFCWTSCVVLIIKDKLTLDYMLSVTTENGDNTQWEVVTMPHCQTMSWRSPSEQLATVTRLPVWLLLLPRTNRTSNGNLTKQQPRTTYNIKSLTQWSSAFQVGMTVPGAGEDDPYPRQSYQEMTGGSSEVLSAAPVKGGVRHQFGRRVCWTAVCFHGI